MNLKTENTVLNYLIHKGRKLLEISLFAYMVIGSVVCVFQLLMLLDGAKEPNWVLFSLTMPAGIVLLSVGIFTLFILIKEDFEDYRSREKNKIRNKSK